MNGLAQLLQGAAIGHSAHVCMRQLINGHIRRHCSWQTGCAGNGAQAAQRALEQEKQQREREHMAAEVLSASVKDLETKTSNLEAKAADLQVSAHSHLPHHFRTQNLMRHRQSAKREPSQSSD